MLAASLTALGLVGALEFEAEGDVVDQAAVRQEPEVLEHHRHLVAAHVEQLLVVGLGDVDAADADRARRGFDQPGEAAHQGALAAARQAHDDEHLALGDVEVDLAHRDDAAGAGLEFVAGQVGLGRPDDALGPVAVDLPQAAHLDHRIRHTRPPGLAMRRERRPT